MNPKYYVSLELANRLKDVGYKQDGEFWWCLYEPENKWYLTPIYATGSTHVAIVSPIASELMDELVKRWGDEWDIWWNDGWHCQTYTIPDADKGYPQIFEGDKNVCTCLAKMYIYLAENKLLIKDKPQ